LWTGQEINCATLLSLRSLVLQGTELDLFDQKKVSKIPTELIVRVKHKGNLYTATIILNEISPNSLDMLDAFQDS